MQDHAKPSRMGKMRKASEFLRKPRDACGASNKQDLKMNPLTVLPSSGNYEHHLTTVMSWLLLTIFHVRRIKKTINWMNQIYIWRTCCKVQIVFIWLNELHGHSAIWRLFKNTKNMQGNLLKRNRNRNATWTFNPLVHVPEANHVHRISARQSINIMPTQWAKNG